MKTTVQELLELEIKEIENKQEQIHKQIKPLNEQLVLLCKERATLQDKLETSRLAEGMSWEEIIDTYTQNPNGIGMPLHKHMHERALSEFDMWASGYNSETQNPCFMIKISKNNLESRSKNLAGLRFLSRLLKPGADGMIRFDIFERTLSAYGSYSLLVKPDLKELTLEHMYHNDETFSSPEEAIIYISVHHWYGK